jgi:hypothetical protein
MSAPVQASTSQVNHLSTAWRDATAELLVHLAVFDAERGAGPHSAPPADSPLSNAITAWVRVSEALTLVCAARYEWWPARFGHKANASLVGYLSWNGTTHDLERFQGDVRELRALVDQAEDEARRELSAATPSASDPGPETSVPAGPLDLVTLDQAAAMVKRTKRSLEHYKARLPAPHIKGGQGKPHQYDWAVIRQWLEAEFHVTLPVRYPVRYP